MKPSRTILVSARLTTLPRQGNSHGAGPRQRYRWRAELFDHKNTSVAVVEGYQFPDQAIGALLRAVARRSKSPEDVFDLVASFFGDLDRHSAETLLGRAVRFACRHPKREHSQCEVVMEEPAVALAAAQEAAPSKGGAA